MITITLIANRKIKIGENKIVLVNHRYILNRNALTRVHCTVNTNLFIIIENIAVTQTMSVACNLFNTIYKEKGSILLIHILN